MVSIPVNASISDEWDLIYDNYHYCSTITVNHNYVDANVINYPLRIDLDSDFYNNSVANNDLIFVDNNGDLLYWELDSNIGNTVIMWVSVNLSASVDTVINCYSMTDDNVSVTNYNNASVVWDNYDCVWHMNGFNNTHLLDSSGNDYHLLLDDYSPVGGDVLPIQNYIPDFCGYCMNFDGDGATATHANDDIFNKYSTNMNLTVCAYTFLKDYGTGATNAIVSSGYACQFELNYVFGTRYGFYSPDATSNSGAYVDLVSSDFVKYVFHGRAYNDSVFVANLFINGSGSWNWDVGQNSSNDKNISDSGSQAFYVGSRFGSRYFKGNISEVRWSRNKLNMTWINLDYLNIAYVSGFININLKCYDDLFPTLQDLNNLYNAMDENLEICIAMVLLTCMLIIGCIFAINVKNNVLDQKQKKEKK